MHEINFVLSSLPNGSSPTSHAGRNGKSNGTKAKFTLSAATMKQLQILRQPTDWVGPVFCNTVRPLLLVQGKWSYQVSIHETLVQQHIDQNSLRHSRSRSRGGFCSDTWSGRTGPSTTTRMKSDGHSITSNVLSTSCTVHVNSPNRELVPSIDKKSPLISLGAR